MNVAASHSEYQIYLINIAPIYDKKQPKKLGNDVVFPIFITSSYNFNDATTYYCLLLQKTYTSKNAQILPSNQNQQKKNQVSPNHFFYLLLIFKDIFELYLCFVSIVEAVYNRKGC